jgi:hypothetical protein
MHSTQKTSKKQENGFINLLFNIVIPSVILIKFTGIDHLGPFYGLIIALAFPVCYGLYDFIVRKDFNILSLFGFISIFLTGIISLVELDKMWIIIKETSIPLLIILFMLIFKKKGLVFFEKTFSEILNSEKIKEKIGKDYDKLWEKYYLIMIIPFTISAVLNFTLAYVLIQNQPGSVEYLQQIGRMTALSFPAIALPSMIVLLGVFYFMFRDIKKKTGFKLEEIVVNK